MYEFEHISTSADNLMVVLRETMGGNKQDEALTPAWPLTVVERPDEPPFELAWFDFLGDIHIRFVFDGKHFMNDATPKDLRRLNLSPEEALALAVSNIKEAYGEPAITPWEGRLYQVQGACPDFDSSYFLDRDLWRDLLADNPDGLVAAVPDRHSLLFTALSDEVEVDTLRRGIATLHEMSEWLRISSALYLFKDDRWTVFQPPLPEPSTPTGGPSPMLTMAMGNTTSR